MSLELKHEFDVCIVGGGAAGMLAGIVLGREGIRCAIIEKNDKLGRKLFITGKGRCNITNFCATEDIYGNITSNARFMYSSIGAFGNYDIYGLFEELGLPLKVERGDRVFPDSDKSSDVIKVLSNELDRLGVKVFLKSEVKKISKGDDFNILTSHDTFGCRYVIIATGGMSYKSTGSTGDGYNWARSFGHKIIKPMPSLVPLNTYEEYASRMMGLSLRNVTGTFKLDEKVIYEEFGEMLFTHFGVSGPIILSASSKINKELSSGKVKLYIDLKPALSTEELDQRILRDFKNNMNKDFRNSLDALLPNKMIDVVIELSKIDPYKKVNLITKEERVRILKLIKEFPLSISSLRSFDEAIITKGGVCVNELVPKTMESKLCENLFFAGEVLDVDALTGGFNLQIAWSSAHAAAVEIVKRIR